MSTSSSFFATFVDRKNGGVEDSWGRGVRAEFYHAAMVRDAYRVTNVMIMMIDTLLRIQANFMNENNY